MRLGAPVFGGYSTPDEWTVTVRRKGYRAAYAPVDTSATDSEVAAYRKAAEDADIVIAEVGAWSNPLSADPATRKAALDKCMASLDLADRLGARCCVNIAGSRGEKWDGPDHRNLTDETFEMVVETTRAIIDAVNPSHAYYCTETMPWVFPDTVDSYLRLLTAVDRSQYAVHCDPVNLVSSPQRYYSNGELIGEFFAKLGPYIKSCHAKDTIITEQLTVHLAETRPGSGALDYRRYLREANKLDPDLPLMIEHLATEADYDAAADYIRAVASELEITWA